VSLTHELRDRLPGDAFVEIHAEPAARSDIRRHEEVLGLRVHVMSLCPFGRVEPQGDPPVTVMIDDIRREGLASHAEIRLTVREHFLAFGKPETDFANRLIDVLRHGPPRYLLRIPGILGSASQARHDSRPQSSM